MVITILIICLITLVLLVTWGKINVFLAFLLVSVMAALLLGMPIPNIVTTVKKGLGAMLGDIVIVIVLGAMLGKLVGASGAAQRIAISMRKLFGEKHLAWAMCTTGFIVGIPLFYNVGFFLLVPIIFSVAGRYKLPYAYVGIPMLASLSVMHGFLPPHPSPMALTSQFGADVTKVFMYGFIVAVPTCAIAGPLFAKTLRNMVTISPFATSVKEMDEKQLPSLANSIISSLLPVIIIGISTLITTFSAGNVQLKNIAVFIADANIAMILTITIATFTLGVNRGMKISQVMDNYTDAIKDIATIMLIIGSAGILKQIFIDSGASAEIAGGLQSLNLPPLLLGWIIAAIIRLAIGSATAAGLTAAGIMFPLMQQIPVDPNLMVLSIGAGSLFCSHVNDTAFWVTKEYFGLTMKQTFLSWSLMETLVSVIGLLGVLLVNVFIQ